MTRFPLFAIAEENSARTAIVDDGGEYTYGTLLRDSERFARGLLAGSADLGEARVAYLVPPGYPHVVAQWGIWRSGGIGVPLALSHPRAELEYVIADSEAETVVVHPDLKDRVLPICQKGGQRLLEVETVETVATAAAPGGDPLPAVDPARGALILYTSGTTGRPKGVVLSFSNLEAQARSLMGPWGWRPTDRILHTLPLHHLHGIVNALLCALWSGATCELLPRFDAETVWERILAGRITLFMAVPTIYVRLIAAWEEIPAQRRRFLSEACSRLRLMVSGSAALPVAVLERWRALSGHVLLERYGMTEIGMALSNPMDGPRLAGKVGRPLPGVELRLRGEDGRLVGSGTPGEIEVKGPGVFRRYWRRKEETRKAFRDGWFLTGDMAVEEEGVYRLLGRKSIDILKSGGYKISALEVEEVLRQHPDLEDCAVVGVEDPEWGQRVCAAVVLKKGRQMAEGELRQWARQRLAVYKAPSRVACLETLPRNAMGKVSKPEVAKMFEDGAVSPS